MRVSVLGLRGFPGVMGGVETHCEEIFPRLHALRPNDDIAVVMRRAYVPAAASGFRGLRLVPLPHLRGKSWEALSSTLCGLLYSRFVLRSDVVHFQGIGPALLAPIARLLGMSVIVTYHSRNYDHAKWGRLGRAALRTGEVFAVRFADEIVVIADWLGRDVRRRYPFAADRVHVVPNGADHLGRRGDGDAADALLARHGCAQGRYAICVGRLVPEKGFDVVVDALERGAWPGKLVISGAADHADDYSRALLARAGDRVAFTGAVDRATLMALLSRASLFVLPSYHEGLPIAALEAASAGVPLLLSDIEPNLDLRLPPHNYFRTGDADDLAGKLAQDHATFGVDAAELLRRYAWDNSARLLSGVYERLVDASRPARRPVLGPARQG